MPPKGSIWCVGTSIAIILVSAIGAGAGETSSSSFIDDLSPESSQPPAVLVRQKGSTGWLPALKGMDLREGDSVKVAGNGTATLKVGGVALVHLEPDSVFTIPDTEENGHQVSTVDLEQGGLWATVKKLVRGESFSVQTKNAVGGIKGTQFRVSQSPRGDTDWSLLDGGVTLAGRGGDPEPVALRAGQMFGYAPGGLRKFPRPQILRGISELRRSFKSRFRTDLPLPRSIERLLKTKQRFVPWRRGALPGGPGGLLQGLPGGRGSRPMVRPGILVPGLPGLGRETVGPRRIDTGRSHLPEPRSTGRQKPLLERRTRRLPGNDGRFRR